MLVVPPHVPQWDLSHTSAQADSAASLCSPSVFSIPPSWPHPPRGWPGFLSSPTEALSWPPWRALNILTLSLPLCLALLHNSHPSCISPKLIHRSRPSSSPVPRKPPGSSQPTMATPFPDSHLCRAPAVLLLIVLSPATCRLREGIDYAFYFLLSLPQSRLGLID